jgi:SAM-dependent methyltransferase
MRDLFAFARIDPEGLDVLEAGSGFGVGLIAAACLGARTAVGVELVDWQAGWARDCAAALPDGLADRIVVHTGSALDMPLEDGCVDVVLSLEAISHYIDYRAFLAEAHRVLRHGGVLIVSDGNNGLNRSVKRRAEFIWSIHEADPRTYDHTLYPEWGEYNPWLLVNKRKDIILARHALSDDEAHDLALNTAGMVKADVEAAADLYVTVGVKPDQRWLPGTLTVHPTQQMVLERPFNPWLLAKEIDAFGFASRVRGHWAGASGKPSHRAVNRVLGAMSQLTMPTARGFRIASVKQ